MTGAVGTKRFPGDAWSGADDGVVGERLRDLAQRLSPTAAAFARMETSVMEQFDAAFVPTSTHDRAAARTATTIPAPGPLARLRGAFGRPPARRIAAVALAASLALGSVAVALAESGPGQPFYRLRLQVEELTLPAPGSSARLEADIERAGSRLFELAGAGRTGDVAAADDSARAYADALMGVLAGGGDPTTSAVLAALFRQHERFLLGVAATASPPARTYVQQAVEAVRRAEDNVKPASGGSVMPRGSAGPERPKKPDADEAPAGAPAIAAPRDETEPHERPTDGTGKPDAGNDREIDAHDKGDRDVDRDGESAPGEGDKPSTAGAADAAEDANDDDSTKSATGGAPAAAGDPKEPPDARVRKASTSKVRHVESNLVRAIDAAVSKPDREKHAETDRSTPHKPPNAIPKAGHAPEQSESTAALAEAARADPDPRREDEESTGRR